MISIMDTCLIKGSRKMNRLTSILVIFLWLVLCGGRGSAFLSCDPLGHDASTDLYSYCNGDPVNGFDPDGRQDASLFPMGPNPYLTPEENEEMRQGYSKGAAEGLLYTAPAGIIGISYLAGPEVGVPTTMAGLRLMGLGVGGGTLAGVGGTAISDMFHLQLSTSQTYFSNGVGGGLGGGLTIVTGNPAFGASFGAFISTTMDDYLNGNSYNPTRELLNTSLGAAAGAAADFLPEFDIDGVNSGSNSLMAISEQIETKTINGTIDNFTWQTTAKILTYQLVTTIPRDSLLNGVQSYLDTSIGGEKDVSGTGTYIQQDAAGKFTKPLQ